MELPVGRQHDVRASPAGASAKARAGESPTKEHDNAADTRRVVPRVAPHNLPSREHADAGGPSEVADRATSPRGAHAVDAGAVAPIHAHTAASSTPPASSLTPCIPARQHACGNAGVNAQATELRWSAVPSRPTRISHQASPANTHRHHAERLTGGDPPAATGSGLIFETAFRDAPVGFALIALNGDWIAVNRALCALTGFSHASLLARPLLQLIAAADRAGVRRQLVRLMSGAAYRFRVEARCVTSSGAKVWVNLSVSLVRSSERQPAYLVAQLEDIEERKRSEASLKHHAEHDSLTGLYNRRMFERELRRQIKRGHRYGETAALLTLDLDNFKHVNDTYGHKAGDDLLRRVAADLRSRHRTTDTLARLGGDEFAVIALSVSLDQAVALGSAFQAVVARSCISVSGRLVGTTASVGVAALDRRVRTATDALAGADGSLYRAKATHDYGRSGSS